MTQYKAGEKEKSKKKRRFLWLLLILLIFLFSYGGYSYVKTALKPEAVIKQSKAVKSVISYNAKTKHYDEPDFGIDIPATWVPVARPAGPYQTFTWQTSDSGTDGQSIQVFEDTIPEKFAVNKVLIVKGEIDHVTLQGTVSDNCSQYTKNPSGISQVGAPARWQNVDFLCDQLNQSRDVIGTSSIDGVNTVVLKSQNTGQNHKFFFTFTAHGVNPDYTLFNNAVLSLKMQ